MMKIDKRHLRHMIREAMDNISHLYETDGLPTFDWSESQNFPQYSPADETGASSFVSDPAHNTMKKKFKSQMRHRVLQFLDFGQSDEKIINAAKTAARELIDEIKEST